jgi:hypothetical protein
VRRLSKRFIVRISPAELDQAKASARGLDMNFSRFVRMALQERAALEAALKRHDEKVATDER